MRKQRLELDLDCLELEPEPPGPDLPLVLGLHGRGLSGEDFAGLANWLNPTGYRFLLPNGPLPIRNAPWESGYAWYVLGQDQAASIARGRELLLRLVETVEARYGTPQRQMVLLGFAQGAVLALDVGLRSPTPFAGVVAMSGFLYSPESLGPALRQGRDRQILLVHGTYDEVVPVDGARLTRDVLEAAGLAPEYHELPLDHRVSPGSLALVRDFLDRVLHPARPAAPASP